MYTSKKEADAHDKMLDIAENLFSFIETCEEITLDEQLLEALTIFLSKNRDDVIQLLKGAKPKAAAPRQPSEETKAPDTQEKKGGRKKTDKEKIRAV